MAKTTIQISDSVRRKLKVLASKRDFSYDEILEDLINIFESAIPFKSEYEFASWFESNLEKLGFEEIIERRKSSSPDYRLKTKNGEIKEVELELTAKDFERHDHNPDEVELIVCVYSDRDEIKGVDILPLIDTEDVKKKAVTSKNRTNIKMPRDLYNDIRDFIKDTGFNSVTEFNRFVLRDIASQGGFEGPEELTEEIRRIRKRLRNLGYIR